MPQLGILGAGPVGRTLAARAAEVGYDVTVGARSPGSASLRELTPHERIRAGTFADAAAAAPLLVNAVSGTSSLDALHSVDPGLLEGKVLLDLANELQPSAGGFPPPLAGPDNSLGQRIQATFPALRVVKGLNTMNHQIMVHPELIEGDHLVFLCGDDARAKQDVTDLLRAFGWRDAQVLDLGGIDAAAATEMVMALWMRVTLARGNQGRFNWATPGVTPG